MGELLIKSPFSNQAISLVKGPGNKGLRLAMKLEQNVRLELSFQQMMALFDYTRLLEEQVIVDDFDSCGMMLKRMTTKLKRRLGKRLLVHKSKYGLTLPSEEAMALCEMFSAVPVTGVYEKVTFNFIKEAIQKFYA